MSHKTYSSDGYNAAASAVFTVGFHDGEIAISLVMLAHLTFDRDSTSYEKVEALLDEAWEYLNSDNQAKDGNYAYVLRKCAPSFEYFQRPMEAQALRDVAREGRICRDTMINHPFRMERRSLKALPLNSLLLF